jgi:hypothetical protein
MELGKGQGTLVATEITLLRSLGKDQEGVGGYKDGAPTELLLGRGIIGALRDLAVGGLELEGLFDDS